jgi:hypothetical protein
MLLGIAPARFNQVCACLFFVFGGVTHKTINENWTSVLPTLFRWSLPRCHG